MTAAPGAGVYRQPPGEPPHLVGSRCRACGFISFPARPVCGGCGAEPVDEVAVGRRGRIRSSAVVHHAPIGFEPPYIVALVELAEGPIVFCPITGVLPEEGTAAPGMAVELTVAPARPGGTAVFQFRPAPG
ncbi:MAG: OB-fold domain-containing protein [Candidatus Rokubacteria bacterium]|nr:OB-fold domain-containing protein [Candidatus Rokubacteria bacterium]MBI3107417.1 OB-fold domain-containing protein [Candidatus Rokubacteria bacterium]